MVTGKRKETEAGVKTQRHRGGEDRHCRQFVINYEDSIRRRYEMEQEAAMRDSIGRLMIQQSKDIRKKMK